MLAAWGIGVDGRKVLLALMAGSKEDVETVRAFFQDLRARGLGDPLLVVSDGAPGIIRAIEECFPRSARQRCLAHRMRNLAIKVSADLWLEFKARVTAAIRRRPEAQEQPQRPPGYYRYVEPPISYQRPTEEDLQAIEKDNERNDLPASHDDIAGAVPIQPDGRHSGDGAWVQRSGNVNR